MLEFERKLASSGFPKPIASRPMLPPASCRETLGHTVLHSGLWRTSLERSVPCCGSSWRPHAISACRPLTVRTAPQVHSTHPTGRVELPKEDNPGAVRLAIVRRF